MSVCSPKNVNNVFTMLDWFNLSTICDIPSIPQIPEIAAIDPIHKGVIAFNLISVVKPLSQQKATIDIPKKNTPKFIRFSILEPYDLIK